MATIAQFVQAVLIVFGLADVAQRLWIIRMQFDFRAFAELAGIVLLIGSIYIIRKDKSDRANKEDRAWKTWLFDFPDTDADAKDDKSLYLRITRLIKTELSNHGAHHPPDAPMPEARQATKPDR